MSSAAASFDGNTWWWMTETRVNYTSALFWSSNSLHFATNDTGDSGMYWQIYTLPNGNVQFRNKNSNTLKQLGICYNADEVSSTKTQMCMEASTADDDQQWTIEAWGDGSYKIHNAANGTDFNADWHPGGPGFISPDVAATPLQPAQHWLFSSIGSVQDGLYSTSIQSSSAAPTSASTTGTSKPASASATATGTGVSGTAAGSSATSTSPATQQKSSSGLSSGAAAGIGVGVAVVVIALAVLAFFFMRRRKNQARNSNMQELPVSGPGDNAYMHGNAVPGAKYEKHSPVHEAPTNQPSYEMYSAHNDAPPVELPSAPGDRGLK